VLLLDPDDAFRTALSDLLQDDGHPVCAYGSIAELPPLARLLPPEALTTDYELADREDGLSFARRFNAVHPYVPVIIVTAYSSVHLEQSVAVTPYLSLLRKPVPYEELHRVLHQLGAQTPRGRGAQG
jgi:DNA-binding NtrC family response regulator